MESKDWISLFVPLLCNGIVLFLFQFYFKRYVEKRDRVRSKRITIFEELYAHTENVQTAMYALLHQKPDYNPDYNFTELFNHVAKQIHQLKRFYDANESQFKAFNAELQEIFSMWDIISNLLKNVIENYGGRVPHETNLQISRNAIRIYELITTILQKCRKKMIDA